MKKVSIVVPIYKSEKFLPTLIQSLKNQTYSNFELILVDDESPDNSGKMCDEYAKEDQRIISVHKKNGGTSDARNYGLKYVTGEYLTFLDGDDWYEPDYLEYLVNLIEKNDCDMSMTDCVMTTSNRKQIKKDKIRVLTSEQALCDIFYVKTPVGAWNKMYKSHIIFDHSIDFPLFWFGEGLYFSAMAAKYSQKIACGHRKIYIYRKNNVNSGTTVRQVSNGIGAIEHTIYVGDKLGKVSKEVRQSIDWHIWKNYFNLVTYILASRETKKYKDDYKKAIKYIRKHGFNVFLKSKVNLKQKLFIMSIWLLPRTTAKLLLSYKKKRLKKDLEISD